MQFPPTRAHGQASTRNVKTHLESIASREPYARKVACAKQNPLAPGRPGGVRCGG